MAIHFSKLPIPMNLREVTLTKVSMAFVSRSLYTSAIWVEKSVYFEIETGNAFTPNMNDENVEKVTT